MAAYYRAVRSVRTSTWVLLIIAIGSNALYYQVRPDPVDGGSRPGGAPVVTEPVPDETLDRPEATTPVDRPPVESTVPETTVDTADTTTTTRDTSSSIVPDGSVVTTPEPDPTEPGGDDRPGDATDPLVTTPDADRTPPTTG